MAEQQLANDHGLAFSRIPCWDGDPTKWRRYKRDVEIWLEGDNLEVGYSVAARMVQRFSGTARLRAQLLDVKDLRPQKPSD